MVGKGSIGRSEVLSPEGGGGVTGIYLHFYLNTHYFQIVVNLSKLIKMAY